MSRISQNSIAYRPEVDGLRAVAVVPIVLFHAGITQISGGFVGVDIFFVISGYLITSIILREIDEDRFTLAGFYRRRAVRILPALLTLIVVVLIVGSILLLPHEIRALGRSAAAAALFASNIWFWRNTDYFGGGAEQEILLHTWSLGVEEQFYLLFPPALLLMMRFFPKALRPALVTLALGSFTLGLAAAFLPQPMALSSIGALRWETMAFYMLPLRGWELLLGALAAIGAMPTVRELRVRNALALIGLAMVATAYLVIEPGRWFPIPAALLPCVGALLFIAYAEGTSAARILSHRSLVWLGAISYSLYLWHWPIMAFYRIETGIARDSIEIAGLIAASLAAGAASYYLVEQPFLRRYRTASSLRVLPAAAVALTAVAGTCILLIGNAERVRPLPPAISEIASFAQYRRTPARAVQYDRHCFSRDSGTLNGDPFDFETCLAPLSQEGSVLLIGDSYMGQFPYAVREALPDTPIAEMTVIGCRPLLRGDGAPRCRAMYDRMFKSEIVARKPQTIVIGARWLEDEMPELEETLRYLVRTVERVVVVGPLVEYEGAVPSLIARSMLRGDGSIASFFDHERVEMNRRVRSLALRTGAQYVDLQAVECPENTCIVLAPDGTPTKFDYGHTTLAGARMLAPVIARAIAPAAQ